jgi:nicotinamidase-related amidase
MPLSQLDPVAALVVLDLQKAIQSFPTIHPVADIVARAAQLARAFRAQKFPVVLVNGAGRAPGRNDLKLNVGPVPPEATRLIPALGQEPSDHLVTKMQVGAFHGTDLDAILRRAGVTQVFLAGISSTGAVEGTARVAHDMGYNVVTVVDATTDTTQAAYDHCVKTLFPRISETAATDEVLAALRSLRKT